jgi:hypothetical protein
MGYVWEWNKEWIVQTMGDKLDTIADRLIKLNISLSGSV